MRTDTAALVRRSARLDTDDVDYDTFLTDRLDESSLRCLRYMHDVESHTMCYLRDVLVTSVHRDPEITAFLACWAYEEHWHGEAIARVLAAHGEDSRKAHLASLRGELGSRDSFRILGFLGASSIWRHLPAVHMAWGAVNEWTTQSGYGRLSAEAGHPVLSTVLGRIMRQEGRHIDFYASQATRMLEASASARRVARLTLRRMWAPVGSGVMPNSEVRFLARHLFGGEEGRAAAKRVDRQVDRLPGLGGLHLLERAVAVRSAA